jgi:hypothetical protein
MIELNDTMRDCLIEANNDCPDLDWVDTVIEAFTRYVSIVGSPMEIESDEEGEELMNAAVRFLIDCVLFNMVDKGVIELDGMEDGELVYKVTAEF